MIGNDENEPAGYLDSQNQLSTRTSTHKNIESIILHTATPYRISARQLFINQDISPKNMPAVHAQILRFNALPDKEGEGKTKPSRNKGPANAKRSLVTEEQSNQEYAIKLLH